MVEIFQEGRGTDERETISELVKRGIHVKCFARGIEKGEIIFLEGTNHGGHRIMCYQINMMLYVMEVSLIGNIGKSLKEFLVKTWKVCLWKKLKHWVKRLFEDDFYDWKIIPLFLIGKQLGKSFEFHNNLDIKNHILSKFPFFYQVILIKSISNFTSKSTLPSIILSEVIWFNSSIKGWQ